MKIVIAPDSFKESLTALEVATAIEIGFKEIFPTAEYVKIPVADGGEGTVQTMIEATGGKLVDVDVTAPLGDKISASYAMIEDGKTAIIEMAAASGLALVPPPRRNPLYTTSYGTGELIRSALDNGARNFIIGIGGSATNDGGIGMLQALGVKFLDSEGLEVSGNALGLEKLAKIDLSQMDKRLKEAHFDVACDVDNPLYGPRGASAIFGPQKGATPEMIERLDVALKKFAEIIEHDLGLETADFLGAGAAGGMGAALKSFMNGTLRQGSEIIMEAVGLDHAVRDADIVITGEGRIDGQTIFGKTPIGVAKVAKRYNKPVIGIAGALRKDAEVVYNHGLDAIYSVLYSICSIDEALQEAFFNLKFASRNIAAAIKIGTYLNDVE